MKEFKYPIGAPTYFEGNIFSNSNKLFGFFYCNITTPDKLLHPILKNKPKTNDGIRTISPLGKFSGWFFSEELYNAQKYGYNFEVLRGYIFESDYIFKGYVNDLYNLRLTYPKTDTMNYIAKLLLNSLYGRFGMDDNFSNSFILNKDEYKEIEESGNNIIDVVELGNNYMVQLKNPDNLLNTRLDGNREVHNVNIAIAENVTAYARIHMSQFKNNLLLPNLYYTDTDSAYFDGPLPDSMIDLKRLGALKLEGIYDKALFLAPKVYALENSITGEKVIKIKGLSKDLIIKNNITLDLLEILLNKDYKLVFNQDKWFKSISQANIQILE
jgi:hypothetical protein